MTANDNQVATLATSNESGGPKKVGRYELIAKIAQGGMATVYLARHAAQAGFQRLVAVKLMHDHLASEQEFVDMLLDEARIAAQIHHPNVVSIVDLGAHENGFFLVMDYIEGCTFSQLLKAASKTWPAKVTAPIVIDALNGLDAAHNQVDDSGDQLGLVHRDVSPQNILVGIDGTARIADFGIAKASQRVTSTRPGVHKGKFAYAAPEQFRDGGEVDARSDVFSMGCVLWSALTGRSLFQGANDGETIRNLMNREVPAPSQVGRRPSAAFDSICLRALARDPRQRFRTAAEMARALRDAANAQGLLGSNEEVARFVRQTFADELSARRACVRRLTHHSAEETRSFRTPSNLGSVPIVTSTTLSPMPSMLPANGTGTPNTVIAMPTASLRRYVWAGFALLSVIATALVALLFRAPEEAKALQDPLPLALPVVDHQVTRLAANPTADAAPPTVTTIAPPAASIAPPTRNEAAPPTASTAPPTRTEAAPPTANTAGLDAAAKKRARPRRRRRRRNRGTPTLPAGRVAPSTTQQPATTKPEKAKPSGETFETNPYLRDR